jgi:hypothetical protein
MENKIRAPEWNDIVEKHIGWWQRVIEKNRASGLSTTITTEFGPFPYLQHFPIHRPQHRVSGM